MRGVKVAALPQEQCAAFLSRLDQAGGVALPAESISGAFEGDVLFEGIRGCEETRILTAVGRMAGEAGPLPHRAVDRVPGEFVLPVAAVAQFRNRLPEQ